MSRHGLIVTGARAVSPDRADEVRAALRRHLAPHTHYRNKCDVYVGDAPGVDAIARGMFEHVPNVRLHVFEASWKQHGRAAGPIRNQEMVDYARSGHVIGMLEYMAFPGPQSRGTWDCIKRMADAGIDGRVFGVR